MQMSRVRRARARSSFQITSCPVAKIQNPGIAGSRGSESGSLSSSLMKPASLSCSPLSTDSGESGRIARASFEHPASALFLSVWLLQERQCFVQGDVRELLALKRWEVIVAFPPCTDTAYMYSGAQYFTDKARRRPAVGWPDVRARAAHGRRRRGNGRAAALGLRRLPCARSRGTGLLDRYR